VSRLGSLDLARSLAPYPAPSCVAPSADSSRYHQGEELSDLEAARWEPGVTRRPVNGAKNHRAGFSRCPQAHLTKNGEDHSPRAGRVWRPIRVE
jgi:hypothetical protein